ncbi:MAG: inorganic phosphate transporter [Clostridia bacterium]|nr:inorganic phosphate transporter [Clostridia bacterium]
MFINTITVIIIVLLIFTNGLTDAPNAIATLVGSKSMKFRKAAIISAIFNLIGIIVMSLVNISVADCISSMVNITAGKEGLISLIAGMSSVIIFALIAMQFGIPTSETHGLVARINRKCNCNIWNISS